MIGTNYLNTTCVENPSPWLSGKPIWVYATHWSLHGSILIRLANYYQCVAMIKLIRHRLIFIWSWPGLGSIPFFQFNSNSNSVIFNSNSNSNPTTHKKFQFQFQFQRFQFQFQFQFRRFQIPAISNLEMTFDAFFEIDYNYTNKVHVYKIIVINTISLISLVKWL